MRRTALVTAFVVVIAGLAAIGGRAIYRELRWKNFAVVEPGKLYRSGQLNERQLRAAIDKLGLKKVVSFTPDTAEREAAICRQAGVEFITLPMPDDGLGRPEQFAEFLRIASDGVNQPTLVHCSAGVARTGAAVALYRMIEQGWPADRALQELRSFERSGRLKPALQEHILQTCDTLRRVGSPSFTRQ